MQELFTIKVKIGIAIKARKGEASLTGGSGSIDVESANEVLHAAQSPSRRGRICFAASKITLEMAKVKREYRSKAYMSGGQKT